MIKHKLVLVRHGQSIWNKENRFTGWTDVDLTELGNEEARSAGRLLLEAGFRFDIAYTSYLRRAVRTLWQIQDVMDQMWLPVDTDWRLNERHYGALQGLNKKETVEKHGADQVQKWRRGYAIRPPSVDINDAHHPTQDERYNGIDNLPNCESLKDTLDRVIPHWNEKVLPALKAGNKPIIVAHGNSLRALVKHLDGVSDDEIVELNIPTGIPLVYEFDQNFNATDHYYLGDQAALETAINQVANQTRK